MAFILCMQNVRKQVSKQQFLYFWRQTWPELSFNMKIFVLRDDLKKNIHFENCVQYFLLLW